MTKRSGIGKNGGDSFSGNTGLPKKPSEISQYRQGNKFSFQIAKKKELDPISDCGNFHLDVGAINLDLINKRGRSQGDVVLYSASQLQNYRSQQARLERGIRTQITNIIQRDGKTVYQFCSHDSPNGFWEVTVESGTFVTLKNPLLTIISVMSGDLILMRLI
jgi:hypothetical protein